ncbi:MAG: L,D-transpeptidase [Anaerolineales bacterium]
MRLSRREFLRIAGLAVSARAGRQLGALQRLLPSRGGLDTWGDQFDPGASLGRVTIARTALRSRPSPDSSFLGWKQQDDVVQVQREVVGQGTRAENHVWMETSQGYLYFPDMQPIVFQPNLPLETLPGGGTWAEVTVPYVDSRSQPSGTAPLGPRLYYASIYQIDALAKDEQGQVWYHIHDPGVYAPAEGLRPIAAEEVSPLSPEVENKKIVVDLVRQDLSAFENEVEVFHATIASGGQFHKQGSSQMVWATSPGSHLVQWKWVGVWMAAGSQAIGYNLPGVGWATFFISTNGVAIHSTYWHNDYGVAKSHGCVNARPQDAHWVFRWTLPAVPYPLGYVKSSLPGGTAVIVKD